MLALKITIGTKYACNLGHKGTNYDCKNDNNGDLM